MNLDPDVVRDQPDDSLGVGWRQGLAGIAKAFAAPADPEATVGIEHHFDDGGTENPTRHRYAPGGVHHSAAPPHPFRPSRRCPHPPPRARRGTGTAPPPNRKP